MVCKKKYIKSQERMNGVIKSHNIYELDKTINYSGTS